jgi:hypothetical protein
MIDAVNDRRLYYHYLPPKGARRAKHYLQYPFLAVRAYFIRLEAVFTLRFLLYLVITQCVIKGLLYRVIGAVMLPLFKGLGIGAASLQLYATIASSPWALKPVLGVISDTVTIFGYHKRFMLLQAICVGLSGACSLVIPNAGVTVFMLGFVAINFEMSTLDLLTEGKYAEIMGENEQSGSDVITFVNGCQMLGSIVAMLFVGPLSDAQQYLILFVIAIMVSIVPLLPTLWGWLPEQRDELHGRKCIYFDKAQFLESKWMFIVVASTGVGGPLMAIVTTFAARSVGLVCAALILIGAIVGAYLTFPRTVSNVMLYLVLIRVSKPSIGAAMDYFYTATPECLPGGPAFSYQYYITLTGILGASVTFVTVWLYQAWMSRWRFRTVLIFTSGLVGASGIIDMMIVLRWNVRIGIPDKVFYVMGEAIIESCVLMLFWIPTSTIISKVCPKGMEASTYAFLAGISNFAGMFAELSGAAIFEAAGIVTTETVCNFDALPWLVLVCHILVPTAVSIPATWLVPNIYQTESVQ